MLGKFDVAECWTRQLLQRARTPIEKARVYGMQLTHLTFCDRMEDAVAAGLRGLRLLGVRLSARPSTAHIVRELVLAKLALGRRRIADLENGPVVDDPAVRLCMRILVDFIPPAYLTGNDKLFAAAVLRQVRLTLKHGVCVESAAAYASYVVLLAGLGDLTSADEFGKLALRLTERFNAVEWRCRNLVLYTLFGQSWARPWREMVPNFQDAVRAGVASGDLLFTAYTCGWVHLWDPDVDVKTAAEEGRKYLDIIEKTEYQNARDAAQLAQQTWANLLGETRDPLSLSDATFNEDACRERMQRVRNVSGLGIHALCRLKLCLLYGEEEQGFAIIQSSRPFIRALAGSPYLVEYCLTAFLISASVAGGARPRRAARREMRRQHARMRRWAAHAPANFGQHVLLMDAECAALAGDVDPGDVAVRARHCRRARGPVPPVRGAGQRTGGALLRASAAWAASPPCTRTRRVTITRGGAPSGRCSFSTAWSGGWPPIRTAASRWRGPTTRTAAAPRRPGGHRRIGVAGRRDDVAGIPGAVRGGDPREAHGPPGHQRARERRRHPGVPAAARARWARAAGSGRHPQRAPSRR